MVGKAFFIISLSSYIQTCDARVVQISDFPKFPQVLSHSHPAPPSNAHASAAFGVCISPCPSTFICFYLTITSLLCISVSPSIFV